MYSVRISNGGCELIDSVYVEDRQGARVAFMNQSCCFGYSDLRGELYVKNPQGNISLFKVAAAPGGGSTFDSIPSGNYIYKSHVNQLTMLNDNNPWVDTYHNGKTDWTKVPSFKLNCNTDTTIVFTMSQMYLDFDFNGTGTISGTVQVINGQSNIPYHKIKTQINEECETKILLYDNLGNLIATTCPDSQGNYSFTNLPAGTYSIVIERTGYEMTEPVTTELDEGEQVVNLNFTVDEESQTVVIGISTAISNQLLEPGNTLNVFPNPARDVLNIKIDTNDSKQAGIVLTDLIGQQNTGNSG
jgi:hypothetical protein